MRVRPRLSGTTAKASSPGARRRWAASAALIVAAGMGALPLHAQSGDGYLFGRPQGSIAIRGGFSHARAGSDLFEYIAQDLTIAKGDFSGAAIGGELGVAATANLDFTLDAGYMRTNTPSHYRYLVDNNDNEIEQTTSLQRVPVTLNAKLYLGSRGREIGRFAWIPSTVTPWVGAGAGFMWYRFQQTGDFVSASTNAIFRSTLESDGWTPMAQAMAGLDVSINPRLAVTGDARYLWAKRPKLSGDFSGFDPIDLSGAAVSLGLTVRL